MMHFLSNKPLVKGVAFVLVILILGLLSLAKIIRSTSKANTLTPSTFINDSATSDTPVETLKTLTAHMSTVEHQNQQLVAQNKILTEQDKTTFEQLKKELQAEVQQQLAHAKAELQTTSLGSPAASVSNEKRNNNGQVTLRAEGLTWILDLQATASPMAKSKTPDPSTSKQLATLLNPGINAQGSSPNSEASDLPLSSSTKTESKKPIQPYYTIPVNATLTGAIAMQPIIGRIPLEGKVHDPYTFKVVLGPQNLTANGIDLPVDIQGIVASGVAEGDLLGRCARGDITSLTFIFADGRISTTQAKESQALGTIAAANGNPCIAGSFHSDAALFLGAQAGLAGLQGYGNALSQAQLNTSTSSTTGASISALIGNANKYAFGQGFAASAQTAQQWWNQRVQSSFDFVYVPNVDPKTGKKLELNINITQEIPIDYNPDGRKVAYGNEKNATNTIQLD